jgi:hypothetical protein
MRTTTVYLTEEEMDALRRTALETGRSQADLIGAGVRCVTGSEGKRRFMSRGAGEGTGDPVGRNFDEYLRQSVGPRYVPNRLRDHCAPLPADR